jgi:hypothetical protein
MATGSTVIPINEGFAKWLENDGLFFQMTVPDGRYPTPIELRQSIAELGYEVKEAIDWIVTSADDYTEVWFQGNKEIEDQPVEFSFLRGGPIVLNIAQRVAERCGSLIVINHSDGMPVVIVPDSVFPISSQDEASTFFDLIALPNSTGTSESAAVSLHCADTSGTTGTTCVYASDSPR